MALLEMSWFGDAQLPLQKRLDNAFKDFKAFLKVRKITCSQPPFSVKLATWLSIHACVYLFMCEVCFNMPA